METEVKTSVGLIEHQKHKRETTLETVKDALAYLTENDIPCTVANIADECGLHPNTVRQPYIMAYLRTQPCFRDGRKPLPQKVSSEQYESEIKLLNEKLKRTLEANRKLREENKNLNTKFKQITDKYMRLLGRFQMMLDEKVIHF